jgi:hypothetical protein
LEFCQHIDVHVFDLHRDLMTEHAVFLAIGDHKVAQLIRQLAQRKRSAEETTLMALPIALLWDVHRPAMNGFVERFDRLLRLHGEPAERAMAVADILTTSTSNAADTFDQMSDALIQGKE